MTDSLYFPKIFGPFRTNWTLKDLCLMQSAAQNRHAYSDVCLQATAAELEQGILTERQCTQLVEQHEAAQDWLREQVKGLAATSSDREALLRTVNTLKVSFK